MFLKIISFIISLIMQLLAHFPLRILQAFGAGLGRLAYYLPNEFKRITSINIQVCLPELDYVAQQALIKASLIETGKTAFEMPVIWSWPTDKLIGLITEVTGEAAVKAALQQERGIILISPHLGAWEVINPYLAKHYPIVIMYKPAKQAYLTDYIHRARKRTGSTLVPTNTTGVKALYRALRDGKVLGILPDQDPASNGGEFAPFFEVPTLTMSLVPRLAHKTGAAIFIVYAERLPKGRGYKLHFQPTGPMLADTDPLVATTALNQVMEHCIRKIPEQYQWSYRRFKRRPKGFPKLY